jgi:aspartate aminotransferase
MPAPSARVRGLVLPPFDVINHRAAALRERGLDVISLGQAVPGFPPPPAALAAAQRALSNPDVHRYAADAGLPSLRDALCGALAREFASDVAPDEVIVTAGGNQAFMLAAMTVLDPGDEVVLPGPYFVNHEMAIRTVGAVPVEAALDESAGFGTRWKDIAPHITSRTRAVVVCSPSNPTGAVTTGEDLADIIHELAERHVALICDETYMHFVFDGRHVTPTSLAGWREHVVVVGTFSKSFAMTGWRVGYMIASRDVVAEAIKIQDAMIICAPVISQVAVEAAVREDWNYMKAFDPELRKRRAALVSGLAGVGGLSWTPAGGGFFAFVRTPSGRDSDALAAAILESVYVVTIPGRAFGKSGEGHLRLSYGAVGVDLLVEACDRLRRFFAQY